MAIISELVTKFSFLGDLTPQQIYNANLKLSIKLLTGFSVAITASVGALVAFVASNTEAADALLDMSAETGISVESIQELGFAAEMSGSSAEAMSASLAGLSKVAGDAARDLGRGKKAFEDLGISVKDANGNVKNADVLFNELRESFARLGTDRNTQKSIIASLGLDASTLQMLNSTTEEIEDLIGTARQLGIVTTEQAQTAADFQDSLGIAKFAVAALSQQIAINLAPATQKITDGFVNFLIANRELIKGGFQWLGEVILATAGFFVRLTPLILGMVSAFVVAKLITGGFASMMTALFSPVVMATIGIAAMLVVIDDLVAAFNGGKSVISDVFMNSFGIDIVPIMHDINDAFKAMVNSVISILQSLFNYWSAMLEVMIKVFRMDFQGALDSLKQYFLPWIEFVKGAFGAMFNYLASGWELILNKIKQGAMSILPNWAVNLISTGKSSADSGSVGSSSVNGSTGPQGAFGGEPIKSPLPSGSGQDSLDVPMLTPNDVVAMTPAGNTSINNSQIKQEIKIDIASSDPKQAGAAVDNALQDQLKTAKTQVNRGGR